MNRLRPGGGFVLLALISAGAIGFFAWGLSTPRLDDFWRLQVRLAIGGAPLDAREFDLMQKVIVRYPKIADNLLEGGQVGLISANDEGVVDVGCAYVLRTKPDARRLIVTASARSPEDPITIHVRTATEKFEAEVSSAAPLSWGLPTSGRFPQLIEIRVGSVKRGRKATAVFVQTEAL
jgi:hypothetical protein